MQNNLETTNNMSYGANQRNSTNSSANKSMDKKLANLHPLNGKEINENDSYTKSNKKGSAKKLEMLINKEYIQHNQNDYSSEFQYNSNHHQNYKNENPMKIDPSYSPNKKVVYHQLQQLENQHQRDSQGNHRNNHHDNKYHQRDNVLKFGSYLNRYYKGALREKVYKNCNNSDFLNEQYVKQFDKANKSSDDFHDNNIITNNNLSLVNNQNSHAREREINNTENDTKNGVEPLDADSTNNNQQTFNNLLTGIFFGNEKKASFHLSIEEECEARKQASFMLLDNSEGAKLAREIKQSTSTKGIKHFKTTLDCYRVSFLSKKKIIECIGKGSFGKVHLGEQIMTKKHVAIKAIDKSAFLIDERSRKKIENEIALFKASSG